LLGDDPVDLAVFYRGQRRPVDLAGRELRAGILQNGRPEQAPDVIGAKWRLGGHGCETLADRLPSCGGGGAWRRKGLRRSTKYRCHPLGG